MFEKCKYHDSCLKLARTDDRHTYYVCPDCGEDFVTELIHDARKW